MKNFLIFLSIFTVVFLAVLDAKDRMRELDTIAGKTPAQVEMKDDLIKPMRDDVKEQINSNVQYSKTPENLFNQKMKEQQSNNIPQQKQPNPLSVEPKNWK